MSYVITQNCCNDAACVPVCPVGCIHPTPDEPGYGNAEMLYIDPRACIDCGACEEACPVGAIAHQDQLTYGPLAAYVAINAEYYDHNPTQHVPPPVPMPAPLARTTTPLRVAIIGAGPSGFYAADQLLRDETVLATVAMFDRLPTPFGLVRAGVAPDHQHTKAVADGFRWAAAHPRFETYYNIEVGHHVTHDELLQHHDAVLYTFGAAHPRRLGIPGEDMPGSHSATDFVAWYNGHPDLADATFDLSSPRVVVVGNGNVALDVARILLLEVDQLAKTDIADHALEALTNSKVEEVVLLGRRDAVHAAYTTPELLAFGALDIDVVVEPNELHHHLPAQDYGGRLKTEVLARIGIPSNQSGRKRLVLKFLASPLELLGTGRVQGVRVGLNRMVTDDSGSPVAEPTGDTLDLETGLVLRSIGYRGRGLPGLLFDERTGTVPNDEGRVVDPASDETLTGVYTAGWIKRGPSGVIGTNKACAAETVSALLADHHAGRLYAPEGGADALLELLVSRQPDLVQRANWQSIDEHELEAGRRTERPRVKLTRTLEMLRVAAAESIA